MKLSFFSSKCNAMIILLASLLIVPSILYAEEVTFEAEAWGFNLVETWKPIDIDSAKSFYSFSDSRQMAFFQVFSWPKESSNAKGISAFIVNTLKSTLADAGTSSFVYNKRPAILTDATWNHGGTEVRGYQMAIEGSVRNFMVLAFSVIKDWEGYHDFLLSLLDSFQSDLAGQLLPGPISQLIADDGWSGGVIKDRSVQIDASQAVIEREARVLLAYVKAETEVQKKAWRRFYQLTWRDSFGRLEGLASDLKQAFDNLKVKKSDIPAKLLSWVQSFTYEEPDSLSDLRAPLDAAYAKLGDCDARSLVYMNLLRYMGFDSILMISPVHKHSLVGVDMPGEGARFEFEGKKWLVAETTVVVPIGMIGEKVADPKDWMGMDLDFLP